MHNISMEVIMHQAFSSPLIFLFNCEQTICIHITNVILSQTLAKINLCVFNTIYSYLIIFHIVNNPNTMICILNV